MSRLIIAANRLPFSLSREGKELCFRQSSGGLVSALKSYFEKQQDKIFTEKIWVGSVDASVEEWEEAQQKKLLSGEYLISPVFPKKKDYDRYYNGFSNSTLWPLFHYFPMLVDYDKSFFESYEKVNRAFADALIAVYEPGDVIWVHDYQLMLLPGMLREKLPEATIGFFLHIPFPSYEIFRLLPVAWKQSLLKGMLGADLIGFHTQDYVQHFIQSAKMILQVENQFNTIQYDTRVIRADLFPIGIDYQKFRDAIFNDIATNISTSLEEKFYNQKIIFSVDRLDYTKGLNHRLRGYEEFLENHPEWRERVVFILNIIPSRDYIPSYVGMRKEIEEKVSSINGRYSSLHWQPLIYRYNHLNFEELCALYQSADVALITPLRDGMNLVAKEYVASCLDKGVLILSELAGAASELSEAILVNPTDVTEVAEAIHDALKMPLIEQRNRLSYMQRRIAAYDINKWINDFIDVLLSVKKEQEKQQVNILDGPATISLLEKYKAAKKRTILLDYDGTLAPFYKHPAMAIPGKEVLQLLTSLAANADTEIVIISGRDGDTLEKWLGHLPLSLVAEHGAQIKFRNEDWQEQVTLSSQWKDQVKPLMDLFVTRCVGSFIEEKKNTLAWHYRNTHPDLGFNRSRELRNALLGLTANTPLQVIDGNKVLEVRQTGIDKGATAVKILDRFNPDFMLCIGDDTTDEDMFRVLRDKATTIKIGGGSTAAEYTLWSQTQVLPLLKKFIFSLPQEKHSNQAHFQ
jgi:trehalose 6-phosphate synthase/phosphatase